MTPNRTIEILLLEDCLEDEEFLREAINEIVEAPHWPNWHSCDLSAVNGMTDALAMLRSKRFDAVLLNLTLPDSPTPFDVFLQVRNAAGGTPILVLADSEDEPLAHSLLREGAQDCLLKSGLDCATLARSLWCSIQRQRRVTALESGQWMDDLTGFHNERGFLAMAEHTVRIAKRRGERLLLAAIELDGLPADSGEEMTLLRSGEILRAWLDETAVLGRIGPRQFGILTATQSETGLERIVDSFERELGQILRLGWCFRFSVRHGLAAYGPGCGCTAADLLQEARSRSMPKTAMLAN